MANDGESIVIPKGWISISLNPLKSRGKLYRPGIEHFAKLIFLGDFPKDKSEVQSVLEGIAESSNQILDSSELLQDLDFGNPEHSREIITRLDANKESIEWWAMMAGHHANEARIAIESKDAEHAVTSMCAAERCRSMQIFKQHFEEVVWMGQGAGRLRDLLEIWTAHKENTDERFWQKIFKEHAYAISQVFAVPLVFIEDGAYVGGMNIQRNNARFVDYLFSVESSSEAILVEIKKPTTKLLGRKYRTAGYAASADLSGSIVQVLDYRRQMMLNLRSLDDGLESRLESFSPRCAIIIGDGEKELTDEKKRRSFELFRSAQKDVEVITYDELFRKIEVLAQLFHLTRAKNDDK